MPTVTLGELAHSVFVGRSLSRIKLAPDAPATPVISARDVQDVLPPVETLETIQAVFNRDLEDVRLQAGDVVVTARGPVRAAVVEDEHKGALAGPNLVVVHLDPGPLPYVLAAYLRHPVIQERLQASTRGTATTGLGVSDLRALPLRRPGAYGLETTSEIVVLTNRYAVAALTAVEKRRQLALRFAYDALLPDPADT